MGQIYPGWKEKLGYTGESSVQAAASVGLTVPAEYYEKSRKTYIELTYNNDVGYTPDGTAMNRAGNAVNHPETIGPDPHRDGSPLPPPLFGFVNAIGYTPDGTPMDLAGNTINHFTGTLPDGGKMANGHFVS